MNFQPADAAAVVTTASLVRRKRIKDAKVMLGMEVLTETEVVVVDEVIVVVGDVVLAMIISNSDQVNLKLVQVASASQTRIDKRMSEVAETTTKPNPLEATFLIKEIEEDIAETEVDFKDNLLHREECPVR